MTVVLLTTAGLLSLAGLLALVRLLRGPTVGDRLVALEALVVIVVMGLAVSAGLRAATSDVIVLVVVALVGFLSTVAVQRLMEHRP